MKMKRWLQLCALSGVLMYSHFNSRPAAAEVYPPLQVNFEDRDPRGGWLTGELVIVDPVSRQKSVEYELFWGNNPHIQLGEYRALTKMKLVGKDSFRMEIKFQELRIPPGATYLIFYSREPEGPSRERLSLPLVDLGVPTKKARALRFRQTSREGTRIQGEIRIFSARGERDLTSYAIYWGSGSDRVLRSTGSIAVIPKLSWKGSLWRGLTAPWRNPSYRIQIDENLPPAATHLLVFTRNEEGQMSEGISYALKLEEGEVPRAELLLRLRPSEPGMITGDVEITRVGEESGLSHYLLCWGKDVDTRLGEDSVLAQFEVRNFRDGIARKELQIKTMGRMDQKMKLVPRKEESDPMRFRFPEKSRIPKGATHLLLLMQQKFWFEEGADSRIGRVIASVPITSESAQLGKSLFRRKIEKERQFYRNLVIRSEPLQEAEASDNASLVADQPEMEDKSTEFDGEELDAADWRVAEYQGLGLGLIFSGLNSLSLFYNLNTSRNGQWHLKFDHSGTAVQGWFKTLRLAGSEADMGSVAKSASGNSLEISRTLFSGGFRWFLGPGWTFGLTGGLYFGAGLGVGYATLKYSGKYTEASSKFTSVETFGATATYYNHSTTGRGSVFFIEMGWQGHRNYSLHLALLPSYYIGYEDGYDEMKIPVNPNQRSTVTERWKSTQNLNRLLLGVGIFF